MANFRAEVYCCPRSYSFHPASTRFHAICLCTYRESEKDKSHTRRADMECVCVRRRHSLSRFWHREQISVWLGRINDISPKGRSDGPYSAIYGTGAEHITARCCVYMCGPIWDHHQASKLSAALYKVHARTLSYVLSVLVLYVHQLQQRYIIIHLWRSGTPPLLNILCLCVRARPAG